MADDGAVAERQLGEVRAVGGEHERGRGAPALATPRDRGPRGRSRAQRRSVIATTRRRRPARRTASQISAKTGSRHHQPPSRRLATTTVTTAAPRGNSVHLVRRRRACARAGRARRRSPRRTRRSRTRRARRVCSIHASSCVATGGERPRDAALGAGRRDRGGSIAAPETSAIACVPAGSFARSRASQTSACATLAPRRGASIHGGSAAAHRQAGVPTPRLASLAVARSPPPRAARPRGGSRGARRPRARPARSPTRRRGPSAPTTPARPAIAPRACAARAKSSHAAATCARGANVSPGSPNGAATTSASHVRTSAGSAIPRRRSRSRRRTSTCARRRVDVQRRRAERMAARDQLEPQRAERERPAAPAPRGDRRPAAPSSASVSGVPISWP